ncbi:FAD-dependent oxidoreductase [Oxalobacteraceae bacterium R-40]|uniref:FAD-dependent oxidoreductase n=1 Tax=Keguizhuia sedimenti TaxID=3064264 RepID=A0ABU1BQJ5_9BURK|nr:FAD-dependent oxidoreductase [Oxalobacteraceae bacterium R-40]
MKAMTNGASQSVWMATAEVPDFPPLERDVSTEVCVIGAGIAGLSTAYLLAKEGKQVVLIDAMGIGAGETGRTTAHFFPPDEWYVDIKKGFGAKKARLIAGGFAQAIDLVESIVASEKIECEFERLDGYLYSLPENGFKDLNREFRVARSAGVDVELLTRVPGLNFDTGPCVKYKNQAQFHPLKYLAGLAWAFIHLGGQIYCKTRARSIDGDERLQTVSTDSNKIHAKSVVVATNTPFRNRVVMHTKQAGYRTYVIGMRVPKNSVPRMLLWDTGDPYYYVRLETPNPNADHEILVVGGADHKVGEDHHPEHRYDEIERWAREHFPMAKTVEYRWSGEVMEPSDGPAYLGRNPPDEKNVYIITGDSGNGMTHCTIGAMIITDLIAGRSNALEEIYDPSRKVKHGIKDFVSEQVDTLSHYADWAKRGEVESAQEIAMGQGAIVQDGINKIAVYRDEQGGLHAVSAKCTHLGCVVHWNSAEKSWDCPCHGSRFAVDGEVLHGPAPSALAAVNLDVQDSMQANSPASNHSSVNKASR